MVSKIMVFDIATSKVAYKSTLVTLIKLLLSLSCASVVPESENRAANLQRK